MCSSRLTFSANIANILTQGRVSCFYRLCTQKQTCKNSKNIPDHKTRDPHPKNSKKFCKSLTVTATRLTHHQILQTLTLQSRVTHCTCSTLFPILPSHYSTKFDSGLPISYSGLQTIEISIFRQPELPDFQFSARASSCFLRLGQIKIAKIGRAHV